MSLRGIVLLRGWTFSSLTRDLETETNKQTSGSTVTLMTEEVEWNPPKCLYRSMDNGNVVLVHGEILHIGKGE